MSVKRGQYPIKAPASAVSGHWKIAGRRAVATRFRTTSLLCVPGTENSGVARKLSASAPDAFAVSMEDMISSGPWTPMTIHSTPRERAADCSVSRWCRGVTLASAIAAIRRACGAASIRMSCRLPSSSGESRLIPVVLPPGRARESTSPTPTHVFGHTDERYSPSRLLEGSRRDVRATDNHIRRSLDDRRQGFGKLAIPDVKAARDDDEVLPLDESGEPQLIEAGDDPWRLPSMGDQKTDAIGTTRLLRACRERPRRRAEKGDELTPLHLLPHA